LAKSKKATLISREIKRIRKPFENLAEDVKILAERQIENAAYMAVTLEELREIIDANGFSDDYTNGANQGGTKKTPEVDIYNTMVKNFNATMKQLNDLLQCSGAGAKSDPLLDFLAEK